MPGQGYPGPRSTAAPARWLPHHRSKTTRRTKQNVRRSRRNMLDNPPPIGTETDLPAHQTPFGNKWQWPRVTASRAIRGEDKAGIAVVGHPCRDLHGWCGVFPGSRDALGSELIERERPEPENRPGFFLARAIRDRRRRDLRPQNRFRSARRMLVFPVLVLSI